MKTKNEENIIYPCCEKCEIYLDYKDSYQCSDGDCNCHQVDKNQSKENSFNLGTPEVKGYKISGASTSLPQSNTMEEEIIKKEVDSLCYYFDWDRSGEQAFQLERSMVSILSQATQEARKSVIEDLLKEFTNVNYSTGIVKDYAKSKGIDLTILSEGK